MYNIIIMIALIILLIHIIGMMTIDLIDRYKSKSRPEKMTLDINPANSEMFLKELDLKLRNEALDLKNQLEKLTLEFFVKEKNGKMFGSISSKQIKDELVKLGYNIDKKQIENASINNLGVHNISLNLYKDIKCLLKIHVKGI